MALYFTRPPLHPLIAAAAVSIILVSTLGLAVLTGVISMPLESSARKTTVATPTGSTLSSVSDVSPASKLSQPSQSDATLALEPTVVTTSTMNAPVVTVDRNGLEQQESILLPEKISVSRAESSIRGTKTELHSEQYLHSHTSGLGKAPIDQTHGDVAHKVVNRQADTLKTRTNSHGYKEALVIHSSSQLAPSYAVTSEPTPSSGSSGEITVSAKPNVRERTSEKEVKATALNSTTEFPPNFNSNQTSNRNVNPPNESLGRTIDRTLSALANAFKSEKNARAVTLEPRSNPDTIETLGN